MARLNLRVVMMVVIMVAVFQLRSAVAEQAIHLVGGKLGWTIPPNGAAFYTSWASKETFMVGDILFFNFTNGPHNVDEVSQAMYGPCIKANTMSPISNAPAALTLKTAGKHYYVCTVGDHCRSGQKLTINVASSGLTPKTDTRPSPTRAMPSSPTTPSPPLSSNATSRTTIVAFNFLAAALAFFYYITICQFIVFLEVF